MTPSERLLWQSKLVGFNTLVRLANTRRRKAIGSEPLAPAPQPGLPAEAELAEVADGSPPAEPPRPSHTGEAKPAYVPPPPNVYVESMCWWRKRGLHEPYDDDPPELDEDDELIYGT